MSDKRYTQDEVNAMVAEIEEGLTDEQVSARKADIEKKYGLSPGALRPRSTPSILRKQGSSAKTKARTIS